jgi:hypothetical protein
MYDAYNYNKTHVNRYTFDDMYSLVYGSLVYSILSTLCVIRVYDFMSTDVRVYRTIEDTRI